MYNIKWKEWLAVGLASTIFVACSSEDIATMEDPNIFVLDFAFEYGDYLHLTAEHITVSKDGNLTLGFVGEDGNMSYGKYGYVIEDNQTLQGAGFSWENDVCSGGNGEFIEKKIRPTHMINSPEGNLTSFSVLAMNGTCGETKVQCAIVGDWEINIEAYEDPYYTSSTAGDFEYYNEYTIDGVTYNEVWVSKPEYVYDSWTGTLLNAPFNKPFIFQKAYYELAENGCAYFSSH